MTINFKNTTSAEIRITDLGGMRITSNDQYEAVTRTLSDIQESADLKTLLTSGDIVWNDGVSDFSASEALLEIQPYSPEKAVSSITLKSPDGKVWIVSVDNSGVISAA